MAISNLTVAIVTASICPLSQKRPLWFVAMLLAVAGVVQLVVERQCRWQRRAQAQFFAVRVLGFFRILLRYFPIMTIKTTENTTGRGDGKVQRAGQEMEQRFLLNRIHVERAGGAVNQCVKRAVAVDAVAAVAAVAGFQPAFGPTRANPSAPTRSCPFLSKRGEPFNHSRKAPGNCAPNDKSQPGRMIRRPGLE